MLPDIVHFAILLALVGTLFRIIEYHFSDTLPGKFLIFAY